MVVKVCPQSLLPTVRQNHASGGVVLEFPDVCHCPVNGGEAMAVHELQETCVAGIESAEFNDAPWVCKCPDGANQHLEGCPFDDCTLGTCHPMCSQVTGDDWNFYCHCPRHG